MSPLPPSLLALLALLGAAPPANTDMLKARWYRALVSQAQLDASNMSESFQVSEEILCAILASSTPWCHLLTYEDTACVLYNVVVDRLDPAPDATTPCRTRHSNVCIMEGAPLPHETKLVHNCHSSLCWNRVVIPYNTVSTCDGDFVQSAFGCIYLHQEGMTWCDARKYCDSLGADLAIVSASEFPAMQSFLLNNANDEQIWVGVKSRMWLDGRDVAANEWHVNEPDGPVDDCVRMYKDVFTYYALLDWGCLDELSFLCKKPV